MHYCCQLKRIDEEKVIEKYKKRHSGKEELRKREKVVLMASKQVASGSKLNK